MALLDAAQLNVVRKVPDALLGVALLVALVASPMGGRKMPRRRGNLSRAIRRPLTATTFDLVFDERSDAAAGHGGADDLEQGLAATSSGDQHAGRTPNER